MTLSIRSRFQLLGAAAIFTLASCATAPPPPPAGPAEKLGREIDQSIDRAGVETGRALTKASRHVDRAAVDVGGFLQDTGRNLARGTFW